MDEQQYDNWQNARQSIWEMISAFFGKDKWEKFIYEQLGKTCVITDIEPFRKISRQSRQIRESERPEMKVNKCSYNDTFNHTKMNGHGR